eukprot:Tbor_TRINITY_DN5255_c4_g3::TRINITY_DN5255_c4_g3_i3::g.16615::m.16615
MNTPSTIEELLREQEELKAAHIALDSEIELVKQHTAKAVSAIEIEGEGINNQLFKRLQVIINDKKITENKIQKEIEETNEITAQIAKGQAAMGELENRIEQEQELILHKLHAQLIEVNHKKVGLERNLAVERWEYLRVLRGMIDDAIRRQRDEQYSSTNLFDRQSSFCVHPVESGIPSGGQEADRNLAYTPAKDITNSNRVSSGEAVVPAIEGDHIPAADDSIIGDRKDRKEGDTCTNDNMPHDLSHSICSCQTPHVGSCTTLQRCSSLSNTIPAVTTGSTRSKHVGSPFLDSTVEVSSPPSPATGVLVLERELNKLMITHLLAEERRAENEEMTSFLSGVLEKCLQETALERDRLASTKAELAKTEADLAVIQARRLGREGDNCSGGEPSPY